jgi:MscS family membrane protein
VTNVVAHAERWAQSATPAAVGPRLSTVMPAILQGVGPYGLAWWQWLALPALAALALGFGRLLGAATRGILARTFRRTRVTWDEHLLQRVTPAVNVLWATVLFHAGLPWLELPQRGYVAVSALVTAVFVVAVYWALWRSVDVFVELTTTRTWSDPSAKSMLIVGGNLLKTAVVLLGAVSTAAAFGYPVSTVIAGLGIGGIAFAFGAQKTIENLFGSIALATDQALRVGDAIKVDGIEGQVERIGARSTRFRTADRTLVTIPNGRLADSRIESLAMRDRLRMATTVMLAFDTTAAQVRGVVEAIEAVLRRHPLVWPDIVVARLSNLSATAIEIEVMCWFETSDYERFRTARQEVLLGIISAVEDAGARFVAPPGPPGPPGVTLPAAR